MCGSVMHSRMQLLLGNTVLIKNIVKNHNIAAFLNNEYLCIEIVFTHLRYSQGWTICYFQQ
jgi:hypothetical protein